MILCVQLPLTVSGCKPRASGDDPTYGHLAPEAYA